MNYLKKLALVFGVLLPGSDRAVFDAVGVETLGPISLEMVGRLAGTVPSATGTTVDGSVLHAIRGVLAGHGRASSFVADSSLSAQGEARRTIYDAGTDGVFKQCARIGEPAPGGGRFERFVSVAKPDGTERGVLISALLAIDSRAGITARNRAVVFGVNSAGTLIRLLSAGQSITDARFGPEPKQVQSFAALTAAAGSIGAARGYDSDGNVNVLVTFTDRTQAVLKIQVP